MSGSIKTLGTISVPPKVAEEYLAWLECKDGLAFLEANANERDLVVYAGLGSTFIHAVVAPVALLTPPDVGDLLHWNSNPCTSWGVTYHFGEPPRAEITSPLYGNGSKTLDAGEQFVFSRHFEGLLGDKHYYEVLQKFTHVFNLHFIPERKAYCRLDENGDLEDVIRILKVDAGARASGTVITFDRQLLEDYMALTGGAIVRMFDFTRFRPSNFSGWTKPNEIVTENGDLFYRSAIEPGHASYTRGCQIIRARTAAEDVATRFGSRLDREDKKYASFIAHDWKNNVLREISCAPGETANYFTKSDLPYEVTPAFFRPEVLSKYKADPEKYKLEHRSISCRGAWHLKTYDINAEGQVHTYLVYLRDLPYQEQLHWKAHNEAPKGPISKRAFTTDIKGEFNEEYDALQSLKRKLHELDEQGAPWWSLRAPQLLDQVHYPATSSADEWASELLRLDQLVVEGFEEKWLRQRAQSLDRIPAAQLRSLKLIEECLIGLGMTDDDARKLTAPLHDVHNLRSKLKGHASGEEATSIKRRKLAEHGTYRKHFESLCAEIDQSLEVISDMLKDKNAAG